MSLCVSTVFYKSKNVWKMSSEKFRTLSSVTPALTGKHSVFGAFGIVAKDSSNERSTTMKWELGIIKESFILFSLSDFRDALSAYTTFTNG